MSPAHAQACIFLSTSISTHKRCRPGSGKTHTTKHLSHYLAVSLFERATQDNLRMKVKFVEVYMVRAYNGKVACYACCCVQL